MASAGREKSTSSRLGSQASQAVEERASRCVIAKAIVGRAAASGGRQDVRVTSVRGRGHHVRAVYVLCFLGTALSEESPMAEAKLRVRIRATPPSRPRMNPLLLVESRRRKVRPTWHQQAKEVR